MKRLPTHRGEHTGDAGTDRIQNNVRDLVSKVGNLLASLARTHGVGVKRITLRSASHQLTVGEIEGAFLVFDGLPPAAVTITVPRATDPGGYGRRVKNLTGQNLTFVNKDGSTTLSAASGERRIIVSAEGPEVWA